jgi:rubrerythrin
VPDALRLLTRRQPLKAVSLLEALSAADIDFTLVAEGGTEHVDPLRGGSGHHAAIEVYVEAERLAEAEAVLRDELAHLTEGLPDSVESQPGHCPACGFHVPEVASECPDCGLVFST